MRISREEMLMEVAHVVAKRGTCFRLKVGAVLSLDGRIISIGYNGSRPGHAHCRPETCNPEHPCTNTIHAERNAINWARLQGVEDFSNMVLYITDSPCLSCVNYILQAGIRVVYYDREYRLTDGIECLKLNNCRVQRLKKSEE